MKNELIKVTVAAMLAANCFMGANAMAAKATPMLHASTYLSPTALAVAPDGKTMFIAYATANQIAIFDVASGKATKAIAVPASPQGLALSADGAKLYVTCAATASTVCIVDVATGKVAATIPAGHNALSPVLSPDGKTLYVCNRFNNNIAAIDLATRKELYRAPVRREPISAALSADGKRLLVSNHLQDGPADVDVVAAYVSVIDTATGKLVKEFQLPNGSGLLRDIRVSPDGKYAAVAHQLGRFHLPTTQLERGWVNTNALTLFDMTKLEMINTVLLDNVDSGAANPWAVAWSADSKQIFVTHAGTHELSIIDASALLEKLAKMPASLDANAKIDYNAASRVAADVPNDLSFLVGVRQRIKLAGNGPRALAVVGSKIYTANYYSDNLSLVDLAAPNVVASAVALTAPRVMSHVRKGDMLWNDATLCFQGWHSCASCHSHDARVDGLNWDLLNDGIGNPKNSKSLLFSFQTPPTTSTGIRENAKVSVRAGLRHILFAVRPEEEAEALDAFLEQLKPIPSPYLVNGKLSTAAQRGKKLFQDKTAGCAECHRGEYMTDKKSRDVGTVGKFDKPADRFDTPTMIELWRSGPYLHDGSAATIRDVLTTHNRADKHGKTSHLSPQQIDDLAEYLLSL